MLGQRAAFLRPPARLTSGLTPDALIYFCFRRGTAAFPGALPVAAGGGFASSRPTLSSPSSRTPSPSPRPLTGREKPLASINVATNGAFPPSVPFPGAFCY